MVSKLHLHFLLMVCCLSSACQWTQPMGVPPGKAVKAYQTEFQKLAEKARNKQPLQGVLTTDQKDSVYVWDYKTLKRIKINGHIEDLVQRTSNKDEFIKASVVDVQSCFYYYALDTAIYRIPLPSSQGS